METVPLQPVDGVAVTTLVDNVTDAPLADAGPVRAPLALAAAGEILRAEHGFSCLVEVTKAGRTTRSSSTPGSRRTA